MMISRLFSAFTCVYAAMDPRRKLDKRVQTSDPEGPTLMQQWLVLGDSDGLRTGTIAR